MNTILIGADFVPTPSNMELFKRGDVALLLGDDLLSLLNNAAYRIFNLEMPLTDHFSQIPKAGPALRADPEALNTYKTLHIDLLTIANNHIMDQGEDGLLNTIRLLDRNGIKHVGAGDSLSSAAEPFFFDVGGKRICVYACVEHEFSIAGENSPGANPYDPLESFDHIAKLSRQSDYLIVLYHGGKEYYRFPSPQIRKVCRKFVDKGAKLVITQHSHCIGCKEEYMQGTIIYGQGNFLFDAADTDCWRTSLLVSLCLDDMSVSFVPLKKNNNTVRLASGEDAKTILADFEKRSCDIQEKDYIEKKYSELASDMIPYYLSVSNGLNSKNLLFRIFNKISSHRLLKFITSRRYKKKKMLALQNIVECEAHRELFLYGLQQRLASPEIPSNPNGFHK